jgi:small GTP-binding protein
MGILISKLLGPPRPKLTALMVGLNDAGKTTILYRLLLGKTLVPHTTRGFNIETVPLDALNMDIVVYDLGGDSDLRHIWSSFIDRADVIIFVVDSGDQARMREAREALWELHSKMSNLVPVLVMCNKQDQPGAATPEETLVHLGLHSIKTGGWRWHAQGTVATTGSGLARGLNALFTMHK